MQGTGEESKGEGEKVGKPKVTEREDRERKMEG